MKSLRLSEHKQKFCLKKNAAKKQKSKTTLTLPYQLNWPNVPQKEEDVICNEIDRLFASLQMSKPKGIDLGDTSHMTVKEKNALKKKKFKEIWGPSQEHRCHLTLGLPQAIRYLEKKELCALLLCRDISPFMMIDPVLSMCSAQGLCAAAMHNLGATLQAALNFRSCKAIGFKKTVASDAANVFHKLYVLLKEKLPSLPAMFEPVRTEKELLHVAAPMKTGTAAKVELPATKNYSYLYIKKKDIEPLPTNKTEDFLALEHNPPLATGNKRKHEDDAGFQVSGRVPKKYQGMKFKQLRAAGKMKTLKND